MAEVAHTMRVLLSCLKYDKLITYILFPLKELGVVLSKSWVIPFDCIFTWEIITLRHRHYIVIIAPGIPTQEGHFSLGQNIVQEWEQDSNTITNASEQ